MDSLNFSFEKEPDTNSPRQTDLTALVDQTSLGTRTQDGLYEVKDWEFANKSEEDDVISQALKSSAAAKAAQPAASSASLGTLGSLFARLTGSKVLTESDLKPVLEGMKQHLMKKNVAKEIADKVCEGVGESLVGKKVGGFQSQFSPLLLILCVVLSAFNSHECRRPSCSLEQFDTYPHT